MPRVALPLLAVSAGLAAAPQDCSSGGPPQGSTFMDVAAVSYDYTFDLTTRQGVSLVALTALTPGDCVSLDFTAGDAAAILMDGVPATWSRITDTALELCGAPHAAGDLVTVSATMVVPLATQAPTDIGYSSTRDADGNAHAYLLSWVEGCGQFGPCIQDPDAFAKISFHVTHPLGYRLLCPGILTSGDSRSTCTMATPVPSYSGFGFTAAPGWVYTPLGTVDGIAVEMYDVFSVKAASQLDFSIYAAYLRWIQAQLGPYPYGDRLRFQVGPHYWWGFEHPGSVSLAEDLPGTVGSYQDPLLHVMMHETTHMWSGNHTTLASTYDFFWKEALAEYLTFIYEDEHLDPAYGTRTLRIWLSGSVDARYYPVPLDEPALLDYYSDVYGPGPMIIGRQLEALLGREAVLDGVRAALTPGGALSVEDLKAALERSTGADLTEYFDEWVYGAGAPRWPVLEVELGTPDADGTYHVVARQVQNTAFIYGLKTTLRLQGAGVGESLDVPLSYGLDGVDDTLTVDVTPGFTVTSYVVDPYDEALVFGAGTEGARWEMAPVRPF